MPSPGQRGVVPWNKGKPKPCPHCGGAKVQNNQGKWLCRPCTRRMKTAYKRRCREEMSQVCPKCGNTKRLAVYPSRQVYICDHCRREKERADYQQRVAEIRVNRSTGWTAVDHGPRWSHRLLELYEAERERRERTP